VTRAEGKIALEEHFVTAELESCIAAVGWDAAAWRRVVDRLEDVDGERLEQMDRLGIARAVLSLGSDGVQGIADPARAVATARAANDALAEIVARRPDRYVGFAAVAMQDPRAAVEEVERAVRELGFRGVLVNGFSDLPGGRAAYYDAPEYLPFWEKLAELGVPLYLHPRNPLPANRGIYEGRDELLGPVWAFAVETGTHALRLVTSGLFDRVPGLTVILGHLGEFLPFAMARAEQRLDHVSGISLDKAPTRVLREHFYVTTSGNCHTPSLLGVVLEMGADRVLFATDYPFEEMHEAASWLDAVPLSDADRTKIGRTNAARLLGL
jgi:gamma-resorcylate decarboxylase